MSRSHRLRAALMEGMSVAVTERTRQSSPSRLTRALDLGPISSISGDRERRISPATVDLNLKTAACLTITPPG
jgi:hypothetical protein